MSLLNLMLLKLYKFKYIYASTNKHLCIYYCLIYIGKYTHICVHKNSIYYMHMYTTLLVSEGHATLELDAAETIRV